MLGWKCVWLVRLMLMTVNCDENCMALKRASVGVMRWKSRKLSFCRTNKNLTEIVSNCYSFSTSSLHGEILKLHFLYFCSLSVSFSAHVKFSSISHFNIHPLWLLSLHILSLMVSPKQQHRNRAHNRHRHWRSVEEEKSGCLRKGKLSPKNKINY